MMPNDSAPLTRRTTLRPPRSRLVLAVMLTLPALALALLAPTRPAPVAAQPDDPDAASWRTALQVAPVTPGEAPISEFFSVILVPPPWAELFSGWVVESAGSTNNGASYDIMIELPNGRAELHGALGRMQYDEALATAPPGCRTVEGRARGYCFRTTPPYEYFPSLHVAASPAIARYGGFETNFGAFVDLTWYDADANLSYSLTIYGPDGAVAQAGFTGQNAAGHVGPAEDLAALASQFIRI